MNKLIAQHCALCGSQIEGPEITSLPRVLFGRSCTILRCLECSIATTVPPPDTDSFYYSGQTHYEERFDRQKTLYRGFANHLLDFLVNQMKQRIVTADPVRLLDVGAGRGWLVEQAKLRGIDAVGVELNRNNVSVAQASGIPLFVDLDEMRHIRPDLQTFDVVVFSAVLEHVPSPVKFLQSFTERLQPGGLVLVAQASFDGLLPRLLPWLWYGWQPAEHFWHFDQVALEKFMVRCGLSDVHLYTTTLHHDFVASSSLSRLVGKNIASVVGRMGAVVGQGDQIYAIGRMLVQPR